MIRKLWRKNEINFENNGSRETLGSTVIDARIRVILGFLVCVTIDSNPRFECKLVTIIYVHSW